MKKFFFALTVALVAVSGAQSQDALLDRLQRIEDNNKSLAARFATVETKTDVLTTKVDELTAKVDKLLTPQKADAKPSLDYIHPCLCGCAETGICICKNCNTGTGFERVPCTQTSAKKIAAPAGSWQCGPGGCSRVPSSSQQYPQPAGQTVYSERGESAGGCGVMSRLFPGRAARVAARRGGGGCR